GRRQARRPARPAAWGLGGTGDGDRGRRRCPRRARAALPPRTGSAARRRGPVWAVSRPRRPDRAVRRPRNYRCVPAPLDLNFLMTSRRTVDEVSGLGALCAVARVAIMFEFLKQPISLKRAPSKVPSAPDEAPDP